MRKNKKLFAILTLVAFMMTLMPVLAFAGDPVARTTATIDTSKIVYTKTGMTIPAGTGNQLWKVVSGALNGAEVSNEIAQANLTAGDKYVAVTSAGGGTITAGDTVDATNVGRAYEVKEMDKKIIDALNAYDIYSKNAAPDKSAADTFTTAFNAIAEDSDAVAKFYASVTNEAAALAIVQQAYAIVAADAFKTIYDNIGDAGMSERDAFLDNYELTTKDAFAKELKKLTIGAGPAKFTDTQVELAVEASKAGSGALGVIKESLSKDGVASIVDATKNFESEKNSAKYDEKADAIITAVTSAGVYDNVRDDTDEKIKTSVETALANSGLNAAQIQLVVDLVTAGAKSDNRKKEEIINGYKGTTPVDPEKPVLTPLPVVPTNASPAASAVATKKSNIDIEASGAADMRFPGGDPVYTAEVEISLKQANQGNATPGTVYVWAEQKGQAGYATDALVIEETGNAKANTGAAVRKITPTQPTVRGNIYQVNANTPVVTLEVAFLRAGEYTLMASTDNPTLKSQTSALDRVTTFAGNKDTSKSAITVTSPAQVTRDFVVVAVADGLATGGETLADSAISKDVVRVNADTVATTEVALTVYKNDSKANAMPTYPIKLSTNSANIELDETAITTNYNGTATFNVAGLREGTYKIYITIGDYESTLRVQVGATSANDIQLIKFPSNPIATDTDVDDYADIFRFQLTDANGNIVARDYAEGARYASLSGDKAKSEEAKYAYIVSAPTANKVQNADLRLAYVGGEDYYTLGLPSGKAFSAEGDYVIRVVLDNGKSATLNFSVKKFDKAVSLHIEYPTTAVELNTRTAVPDIYFLDANNVMKKANNRVTVAAQGYAVASVEGNGKAAGRLTIKNDEKYIGQTITVTAASDKENLMASTTLTVADEAREVKLDTNRGPVNANNRVGFKVIDSTGHTVALGNEADVEVTAVVTNTGDAEAKVSYSVTATSENDLKKQGTGTINLSSNKQTTATVQIMVKVTKTNRNATSGSLETNDKDNNTGLSTTYYSGTETFTFGAEADKSVVMTIGSKEIVAQNVPVTIDVAPFIQDNRTYVPFRALVEAFGAEVDYNADNNTVTTKLDGKTVVLTVGSTVLTVNDETVTMDVAPFIVDDRVVVPVRFVGEAFGFTVEATQDADTGATASVVFYQK